MRNIKNIPLRKLLRNKRFTSTVSNWGGRSTTYNYRITNIKQEYGKDDPTCTNRDWYNTVINIVCSAYTTNPVMKKRTNKTYKMTDDQRIDKRFNPVIQEIVARDMVNGLTAYNGILENQDDK